MRVDYPRGRHWQVPVHAKSGETNAFASRSHIAACRPRDSNRDRHRRRDIPTQFFAESIIITVAGCVIGVAAAIGIFFGLYPARKAARLNPIEALRYQRMR